MRHGFEYQSPAPPLGMYFFLLISLQKESRGKQAHNRNKPRFPPRSTRRIGLLRRCAARSRTRTTRSGRFRTTTRRRSHPWEQGFPTQLREPPGKHSLFCCRAGLDARQHSGGAPEGGAFASVEGRARLVAVALGADEVFANTVFDARRVAAVLRQDLIGPQETEEDGRGEETHRRVEELGDVKKVVE